MRGFTGFLNVGDANAAANPPRSASFLRVSIVLNRFLAGIVTPPSYANLSSQLPASAVIV
jgi:hypothetical protein